ncbi:MAG: cysteine--tRNA ligase [Planctomycetota bacterium]|jgi:cysteinyl-tRNA synthetase
MALRFYNTLTRREETFEPLDETGKTVTFYSCGPTVYDYAHIGNFRSFLNADVLRRTLELIGYEVRQVMNITDVGHMTEDDVADGLGEDKMEAAARRLLEDKKSGKLPSEATDVDPADPMAIADFYTDRFLEDARTLGMRVVRDAEAHPELMPRPTRYVGPMIELVERLIEREHAYVASDGVVYFDVQSFPEYGRLSGNTPDQIRSGEGGRVDEATQAIKRHPADFMLWKPDQAHIMKWPSPWGEGYPGWHLECSVMAQHLLGGETGMIDIHSGGEDNIFPHHECEIAQACCATGASHFARYWFHTRFLIVEGEKMSKSKGNFFTVRDLLAKGKSPAAIRFELIKTHYRSQSNFTMQGLTDAQRQIDRWGRVEQWLETHRDAPQPDAEGGPLARALPAFTAALCADLNVSGAIGTLNQAIGELSIDAPPAPGPADNPTYAQELEALHRMDSVLGVLELEREGQVDTGDLDVAWIQQKIAEREDARGRKDWTAADHARDELAAVGIVLKDGPEGTTWRRSG